MARILSIGTGLTHKQKPRLLRKFPSEYGISVSNRLGRNKSKNEAISVT
jgi:hypothetical protein